MVSEDYLFLKTARLLKENGFNIPCLAYYDDHENFFIDMDNLPNSELPDGYCAAPTIQVAMKWLREDRKIFAYPEFNPYDDYHYWGFTIYRLEFTNPHHSIICASQNHWYKTYEDAAEGAIIYCIINKL